MFKERPASVSSVCVVAEETDKMEAYLRSQVLCGGNCVGYEEGELTLDELLEKVGESGVLSTLDLTSGFHQIPIDEKSMELTMFVCPLGKFMFKRMPFGLKNAPAVFQRVIEKVLEPVKGVSTVYIDDVIVYSRDWESHTRDLRCVLECIKESGMTAKLRKCVFGRCRLKYLGHIVGDGRVYVPENRVEAFRHYGLPNTKKQHRTFLGAIGYYRRFIKGFVDHSSLLMPGMSLSSPRLVMWSEEMKLAFTRLCELLCNSVVLFVPHPSDSFVLYTDTLGAGLGACLHAKREDGEVPIAFSPGSCMAGREITA